MLNKRNLTSQEWKEALPLHLRTANADEFEEPFWMARQRESTQYHCISQMKRLVVNSRSPCSSHHISRIPQCQKAILQSQTFQREFQYTRTQSHFIGNRSTTMCGGCTWKYCPYTRLLGSLPSSSELDTSLLLLVIGFACFHRPS